MISATVTVKDADAREFLVTLEGEVRNRKGLNDALGKRLAKELQAHFRQRNTEPNKLNAPKTNFWKEVAEATTLVEVTDTGASVAVADVRYRIQLFGGTVKAVNGRFLTIPLIKEAHGLRVSLYESRSKNKLFRLGRGRVLYERPDQGDRSTVSQSEASVRTRGGFRQIRLRERSRIRPVYALKENVTIKKDPDARPSDEALVSALTETAGRWVARQNRRGGLA